MNKTKTNYCIMCNGSVPKNRKIIYRTTRIHCCTECHHVFINPAKYNFIEDESTLRHCRRCKTKHPQILAYFTFNPITKNWATRCRQPAPPELPRSVTDSSPIIEPELSSLSLEELLTKMNLEPIKRNRGRAMKYDYHSPLIGLLSEREKQYLKNLYIRTVKHNERNHKGTTMSFKELVEMYFRQEHRCFYTNLEMNFSKNHPLSTSIRRLDTSIGFKMDNIVFCCLFFNKALSMFPLDEVRKYWKYLPVD